MAHWLVKQEPGSYSWQRFAKEKRTAWDGVRNAEARNNLAAMNKGDEVLFYHSGDEKAVVGVAKVVRTAYPDPTSEDPRWLAVDLAPVRALPVPVPLATMRRTPKLAEMALLRKSRLSVVPLTAAEYRVVLALGGDTE